MALGGLLALLALVGVTAVYAEFGSLDPTQPPMHILYCDTTYHKTTSTRPAAQITESVHQVGTWINGSQVLAANIGAAGPGNGRLCPLEAYVKTGGDSYVAYLRYGGP
jgi:hypothetical protein